LEERVEEGSAHGLVLAYLSGHFRIRSDFITHFILNTMDKSKNKSIWEQVKNEDKDWFFNFLEKKVRNLNKKMKEIERLEESDPKDLKQEQIGKI
jgi:hypothetical protein